MTDYLGKTASDEWNPPTCNKDVRTKQMSPLSEFSEQSFLKFPPVEATGLGLIDVSFCALVWHAGLLPFQLHVCNVESWQLLGVGGFLGGNMWCDPARSSPVLSVTQKLLEWMGIQSRLPMAKVLEFQTNQSNTVVPPVTCSLTLACVCL